MKYSKITISGKICSGKSTLFQLLKQYLKWPTVQTGQIFRDYVEKHNLNLDKAQEQNEKLAKKIDYKVRRMLKKPKGNLLADSWMAGVMADDFSHVLRVLLICDNNERYRRFAEREKVSFAKAKKMVEERQKSWLDRIEKIYRRRDIFDSKNYNLVINTTNLSTNEILQQVLEKLNAK